MKKVLLVVESNKSGGIKTVVNNLAQKLKNEYEVTILYLMGKESNIFPLKVPKIMGLRQLAMIMKTISLFIKIKKEKYDYIISNGSFSNFFVGLVINKKNKTIATIHSVQSKEAKRKSFYSKLCNISNKILLENFSVIIGVSLEIVKDLEMTYPKLVNKKKYCVYNGFSIEKIRNLSMEVNEFSEEKYFIFIGRLVKEKQIDELLKLYFHYLKNGYNDKFMIVGSGVEENKIKEIIEKYSLKDKIILLGNQTNPYKYLKNAKALLLCSSYEGLPSVIIESLILNVPIISTECCLGIWEIILENKIKIKENYITQYGIISPYIKSEVSKNIDLTKEEREYIKAMEYLSKNNLKNKMDNKFIIEKFDDLKNFEKIKKIMESIDENKIL